MSPLAVARSKLALLVLPDESRAVKLTFWTSMLVALPERTPEGENLRPLGSVPLTVHVIGSTPPWVLRDWL